MYLFVYVCGGRKNFGSRGFFSRSRLPNFADRDSEKKRVLLRRIRVAILMFEFVYFSIDERSFFLKDLSIRPMIYF